jgi:hypothetical protein
MNHWRLAIGDCGLQLAIFDWGLMGRLRPFANPQSTHSNPQSSIGNSKSAIANRQSPIR